MPTLFDDLGRPLSLVRPPTRIVSLVPSLTEALATTVPERLVGATDYCTHTGTVEPARVRGTKNPDHAAIGRLQPDLVVANREENRQVDVDRMAAVGIPVWVTEVDSLDAAFASFRRLFGDVLGVEVPPWVPDAERQWSRPPELPGTRALAPIWRDPWMVVGGATFAGDVVRRLGLVNVVDDEPERYPKRTLEELTGLGPELVLLADEPYSFSATDGPEAFGGTVTALVSGRDLTWYGPSLVTARGRLTQAIMGALGAPDSG
jgi:ABC-type Fe3+-hydroxamate transport system substrate-binding protein